MNTHESSKIVAGEHSMGLGRHGRVSGSVWRQGRRALVVGAVSVIALVGSGLSAQAAPGPKPLTGAALAESVAAWAKAADVAHRGTGVVPTIPLEPADPTVTPSSDPASDVGPVASGDVVAGQGGAVAVPADAAGAAGVSVDFSGYRLASDVSVNVLEVPASDVASAGAQVGGLVLSAGVQVLAADDADAQVTQFPNQLVDRTTGADVTDVAKDAEAAAARSKAKLKKTVVSSAVPAVTNDQVAAPDVVPGVKIAIPVDVAALKAARVDWSSIKIATRESDADAWTVLPSAFDAKAGVVRGEANHLSQFVVIGKPFVPYVGPTIVLDPDNDNAYATDTGPYITSFASNLKLAQDVKAELESECGSKAVLTRTDAGDISHDLRALIVANTHPDNDPSKPADVVLTITFNSTPGGGSFGTQTNRYTTGGSIVYFNEGTQGEFLTRHFIADTYVDTSLDTWVSRWTDRPFKVLNRAGNPFPEFTSAVDEQATAVAQLYPLFLNNVFDRPIINDQGNPSGPWSKLVAATALPIEDYVLERNGSYQCNNPDLAQTGRPSPPTAAELAAWRELGDQSYQMYGAEPVSFATGNLFEKFPLFTLPGTGGQETGVTLFYNSQDGRLTRSGAGWSFDFGARAQRFDDNSVLIVRGDGASYLFTPNGSGGYTPGPGTQATLREVGGGLLELKSDPNGTGAGLSGNQTWVFNTNNPEGVGDLVSRTDATGNTTTLTYGARTDASQFTPLTSITDASGQVISVGSDVQGRVTSFSLPDGRSWGLAYDGDGNLASIGYPNASSQTFTYDGAGHHLITATDGLGTQYLRNEYDAQARVVKQWDAENTQRSFTYEAGKTTYVDNEGNTHVFHMDGQFHVTQVDNPDGSTSKYEVNGNDQTTSYTDENGGRWDYEYDGTGNLTKQIAPADTNGHRAVTSYTYAPGGHVTSVTDEGGIDGAARTTSYDVDAAGRTTAAHFPNGTSETYVYDVAGNVTSVTDAAGGVTTYAYNASGDVTSKTDALGNVTTYAYDGGGHLVTQTDALGGIARFEWSGENLTASMDPLGARTTYVYDVNSHMTSMTDPLGRVTSYGWDSMFRQNSTTAADGGVERIEYNREDVVIAIIDPLGRRIGLSSDARKQITGQVASDGGVTSNVLDAGGRVTSMTNALGGVTSYTYDALGNVLTATNPLGG